MTASAVPLRDVDLYWHLLVGRGLFAGTPLAQIGSDWSIASPASWISTQWLAEVALHQIHALGGWPALAAYRVISLSLVLGVLAWTTLRGRPASRAALPFLFAAWAVWLPSEERPQQVTFLGAALLGGILLHGLVHGRLPRWWALLPLTLLWANLHGGWVLVPGVLLLIALGRLVDQGRRDRTAALAAALSGSALLVGFVSPAGLANVSAVTRFGTAASDAISEWQRTAPLTLQGLPTVGMLLLVSLAWARRGARIPRSEILTVSALLLFAWAAWRNIAPAALLMAPLVAHSLCRSFPGPGTRERPWSAPLGVALAVLGLIAGIAGIWNRENLPRDEYPIDLAARISSLPGDQRVLNDYAVGGMILYFGGDSARVAIDGRADRYGSAYISRYLRALELQGDWSALVEELSPTSALLEANAPIAHVLQTERGWQVLGRRGDWVLLTAPSRAASTSGR